MRKKYRAVLFDMDDTLIRTREVRYRAQKYLAKKHYHLEFTDEHINKHWGKPFLEMMRGLYPEEINVEEAIERYYEVAEEFPIKPYEGVKGMLERVVERIQVVGLVTAANRKLMKGALRDAEIREEVFHYIQTSDDTTFHKPDSRVFDPAVEYLRKRGIEAEEVLYVGDAIADYLAANGAGLSFIGIADHTCSAENFRKAGAETIADFRELLTLLG